MMNIISNLASRKKVINNDLSMSRNTVEIDQVTREKLQKTLLEMFKDILKTCNEYGLVPFLIGGSALGAYRHQGFIPWDDDLDIGMTRDDYNVFRRIFKKELGDRYLINAPNYSGSPKARFPKVIKKGTLCREQGDHSPADQCGIFVDIFILDKVPENKIKRYAKGIFCNALEFIAGQVQTEENMDEIVKEGFRKEGRAVYCIRRGIGTAFRFINAGYWFNGIDKAVRYDASSDLVGIVTGRKHYFGEIFHKDVISPPRYIKFCDIEAPVFHKVEEYLENLYGSDYMQLPPEEKRESHYFVELRF